MSFLYRGLRPNQPIYDVVKRKGSVIVGNTPPGPPPGPIAVWGSTSPTGVPTYPAAVPAGALAVLWYTCSAGISNTPSVVVSAFNAAGWTAVATQGFGGRGVVASRVCAGTEGGVNAPIPDGAREIGIIGVFTGATAVAGAVTTATGHYPAIGGTGGTVVSAGHAMFSGELTPTTPSGSTFYRVTAYHSADTLIVIGENADDGEEIGPTIGFHSQFVGTKVRIT